MALTPRLIVRLPAPALRGEGDIGVNINARWLDPVRFVATSGALSSFVTGASYAGLTLAAGDTFLYQPVTSGASTPGITNGIYVVGAGAPVRRTDADTGAELWNASVLVQAGIPGAGQTWINVNATAPVVGTDNITFRPFGSAADTAQFESRSAAQASSIASSHNVIHTLSYATAGDGGGAVYKRSGTAPTHALWFQSADGAYWEYNDIDGVNVMAAGAKGDAVYSASTGLWTGTDDTVALQNCIDAATYFGIGGGWVRFPGKAFLISRGLHAGYGDTFRTTRLIGQSSFVAGAAFFGTVIAKTFSNEPGINLQGQRNCYIKGITIAGRNQKYVVDNNLGNNTATLDDTLPATWVDPALHANADSRYAPDCGFCIGAYNGAAPTPAYPSVNYPSWTGIATQYNKNFSSIFTFEDCAVVGCVNGIVCYPNSDGNGDFMRVRRFEAFCCKNAVSIANSQARNMGLSDLIVHNCYQMLTTAEHGTQNGKVHSPISNCSCYSVNRIFTIGNSTWVAGPLTFHNLYAEGLWMIGVAATGTTIETGIQFTNPSLHFGAQTNTRGFPAYIFSGGQSSPAHIQVNGGLFNLASVYGFNTFSQFLEINGVMIQGKARTQLYEKFAHNALAGGLVMKNLGYQSTPQGRPQFRGHHELYDLSTGATVGASRMAQADMGSKRLYCTPIYVERHAPYNGVRDDVVRMPEPCIPQAKSGLASFVINTDLSAVITFSSRTEALFLRSGPLPGDVVYDDQTGTVWFVSSRTALAVTMIQQNNYKSAGGGTYTALTAISTTVGNLYFAISRMNMPEYFLRGDTATGSAVITNASRDDAYAGFLTTSISVGDMIVRNDLTDNWVSEANAVVTAVDNAAKTITLTGNPTQAITKKRIGSLIRTAPANFP